MGRKPSNIVNAEVNNLRRIIENPNNYNKTDADIMLDLNIGRATYYRYKQKIKEQDIAAWHEIAKESQEQALLKIKKALDYTTGIYKDIVDHAPDQRARIVAAQQIIQNNVWNLKLLEKGPKIYPKLEAKLNEQTETMGSIQHTTV